MNTQTIVIVLIAILLIWSCLSSAMYRNHHYNQYDHYGRHGRYQYGGMSPGVFDQLGSDSGPEDAYLITPDGMGDGYGYNYGYGLGPGYGYGYY